MAISDSPVKSIGLLVGVALVGTIFIVATANLRNQAPKEAPITSKPYSEPTSGIVFDAPAEWSVGISSGNTLIARGIRIDDIQSQRGTCSNFSKGGSDSIARAVLAEDKQAVSDWQKQYPGLIGAKLVKGASGIVALIGVDSCSQSLSQRVLTLRGQAYRSDVEIRFSSNLVVDQDLSQSQIEAQARALSQGNSTANQAVYNQFLSMIGSLR